MGLILNKLRNIGVKRVYFDSNIFIYALEAIAPYAEEIKEVFESVDSGEMFATTSELSLAECLVKPFMENDSINQANYENVHKSSETFRVNSITREILKKAAFLRAKNNTLRLPDAIHVATGIDNQCNVFLTNDSRIKTVPEIQILCLNDIIK